MRQVVAIAIVASALLAPAAAGAGERVTDGALGAASGALVGGPVGFVAGGVIGFVAGPNIAHGMGLRHHRHYYDRHYARRSSAAEHGNERAAEADPSGR
jgi:hypothetical protein